jgi:photosystem II stability/assembly factor-like uncharacterized protein
MRRRYAPFVGLLGLTVLLYAAAAAPALNDDPARQKQIDDLEKRIADEAKRLEEMRNQLNNLKTNKPAAPPANTIPDAWVKGFSWRCIGPANMSGRITDISVFEADPTTFWVATASGGLLKTTNNGVTFEHQFDKESTVSIGSVCVAPSNKDIVWVGTGENNPRNSVSYGDGVYKSTDGGKTWKNMGLKETFQIGKVIVHPKNPDTVYVGALGRLYGPNPERGLYKTTDGGKTWNKILYFDDKTGVIDMVMHPTEPDTLLVAMWERRRDGFDAFVGEPQPPDGYDGYDPDIKWGPHAGIYKTTDGGKSFKKLTKGLPSNKFGRVGLDYYRKNPNVIFAIVDCEKIGMGPASATPAGGDGPPYMGIMGEDDIAGGAVLTQITENSPALKAGLKANDVITAIDGKAMKNYDAVLELLQSKKVGDKVKVKIQRGKESQEITVTLEARPRGFGGGQFGPGGGTRTRPFAAYYGGQRENAQDRQGKDGHEYGGVYKSTDGGESWTRINSINPRPMYFSLIRVDPTDENNLYVGGIQLHRSKNGGKNFTGDAGRNVHADFHSMWIDPKDGRHMFVGCDGGFYVSYDRSENWDHINTMAMGQFYHVAVDNRKPYWVYGGLQDNGSWGGPSRTLSGTGALNEDWISVGGGDGFVCRVDQNDPDWVYSESQGGFMSRRNLRTGQGAAIRPRQAQGAKPYRFNWNTPFILSHHNSKIFYCAAENVFRCVNQGRDLKIISPEITLTKRGSATALAESPRTPDVLWAGTDDGGLWVTKDGGKTWNNVTKNVGLPKPYWVSTIEPSRYADGRAYVCFDAHRSNDDKPYLYVTEDYGQTWKSINANLPSFGSSRCLREDTQNENLLLCGTEFAVFASVDRGGSWTKINNNLPTVAVHELAIHPTAGEVVAATHGRSLWVMEITPLRQMTPEVLKAQAYLFAPSTGTQWRREPGRGGTNRRFVGQNPPPGAQIYFTLGTKAQEVDLKVVDAQGRTMRTLAVSSEPGFHRSSWNLTRQQPQADGRGGPGGRGAGGGGRGGGFGGRGGQFGGIPVPAGFYKIVLTVDKKEYVQTIRVENDPNLPSGAITEGEEEPTTELPRAKKFVPIDD